MLKLLRRFYTDQVKCTIWLSLPGTGGGEAGGVGGGYGGGIGVDGADWENRIMINRHFTWWLK